MKIIGAQILDNRNLRVTVRYENGAVDQVEFAPGFSMHVLQEDGKTEKILDPIESIHYFLEQEEKRKLAPENPPIDPVKLVAE